MFAAGVNVDKIWFIAVQGKQEGPYSILDLKRDPRITPDTLVWKEGFVNWLPMRHVPELKEVFKDEPEAKPLQEEAKPSPRSNDLYKQETLILQRDPIQFFLWILVAILIILYLYYQFFQK